MDKYLDSYWIYEDSENNKFFKVVGHNGKYRIDIQSKYKYIGRIYREDDRWLSNFVIRKTIDRFVRTENPTTISAKLIFKERYAPYVGIYYEDHLIPYQQNLVSEIPSILLSVTPIEAYTDQDIKDVHDYVLKYLDTLPEESFLQFKTFSKFYEYHQDEEATLGQYHLHYLFYTLPADRARKIVDMSWFIRSHIDHLNNPNIQKYLMKCYED